MKAALIHSYGSADVLEFHSEVKIPEPQKNEVLIRVKAASINPVDWKIRKGLIKFLNSYNFPKILGLDFAGEVVGIGNQVSHFRIGEPVFGMLQSFVQGSYAQFTVAKQKNLLHKPQNLSFEESAAVPLAGLTAYQGLALGGLDQDKRVLILGGAGGVGSFAVQIAKAYGCHVTASAGPSNQLFLHDLGADQTFDYTCQTVRDIEGKFDIIFDTVAKEQFKHCRPLLSPKGVYVTTVPTMNNLPGFLLSPFKSQKAKVFVTRSNMRDLELLKKMLEMGKIRAIIDRVYRLEQIREAHLFAETGHARGKIVITIPD